MPDPLDNLPGFATVWGTALAATLRAQCDAAEVVTVVDAHASLEPGGLRVRAGARTLSARAVVLATGVRRRRLGIVGELSLAGVWTNLGADRARFAGLRALVVGGGDDAFEHARLLAPHAASVVIACRGGAPSARSALLDAVRGDRRVAVRTDTVVLSLSGNGRVEQARLRGPNGVSEEGFDAVFVCVGPEPLSAGFGVATDGRGYVRVDRLQRTSRPGVLAVGDLCCPEAPTVATALGHGAIAAKVIVAGATTAAAPRADVLTLHRLTLPARIGVYPSEWERPQTLSFDIAFEVDAAAAAPSDALRCTVDYAAVAAMTEAMLEEQHYKLIETVADRLATRLLAGFDARAVRVRVTKPGVPQPHTSASIEVERRRAD
jgi:thioredoxin reductase (NADPH)